MTDLIVSDLRCYPLKSARGHSLAQATSDGFGLSGDRRWLVIDAAGQFVSQRSHARLALLDVVSTPDGLQLSFAGESIDVARPETSAPRVASTVWGDTIDALLADVVVSEWLSRHFAAQWRLVFCPDDALRRVDSDYAADGQRVAFADGFPLLLIGQSSLEALNAKLDEPVPMDRFRPNLVISGATPYAEDEWKKLRVGDVEIDVVKPCSRCAIPSINQQTAERDSAINRVLASYRRREGVIYFGMNALLPAGATLRVGDCVEILT